MDFAPPDVVEAFLHQHVYKELQVAHCVCARVRACIKWVRASIVG